MDEVDIIDLRIIDTEVDENFNIDRIELEDGLYLVPALVNGVPVIIIE